MTRKGLNEDTLMSAVYVVSVLVGAAGAWLIEPAARLIVFGVSGVVTSFLYARGAQRESEQR